MSSDGIVFATFVLATLLVIGWLGWRRLRAPKPQTAAEQRNDTFAAILADHVVDATSKSGRTPWL